MSEMVRKWIPVNYEKEIHCNFNIFMPEFYLKLLFRNCKKSTDPERMDAGFFCRLLQRRVD